jgi:hypothetical protein
VAGLHAQTLAERRFVTLAFDPSFTGERRYCAQRGVAGVLHRGLQRRSRPPGLRPNVDRERIGAIAICGLEHGADLG